MDLYRQQLLDHYHHPRNFGELTGATHRNRGVNPLCGDEITVYMKIEDERVSAMTFTGQGCVISQAAASLLSESVPGKTVAEAAALTINEVNALLGVQVPPSRYACTLLALEALQQICRS